MARVPERRGCRPEVVSRGEVWLTSLDPTVGSEIRKTRPCLIVSPAELNDRLRTVIVAPLTTGARLTRFRVEVAFGGRPGLILLDQLRTVDKGRLLKRLGEAPSDVLADALAKLRAAFAP